MFTCLPRKSASSLVELASAVTTGLLTSFIAGPQGSQLRAVQKLRRHVRKQLPARLITRLLGRLVPGQEAVDKWRFPCTEGEERLACRIHWQCELVQGKLPEILAALFSEDISHLRINLKRVRPDLYHSVMDSFLWVVTKAPVRPFPNLSSLALGGGTVHSDDLVTKVEQLVGVLAVAATRLEHLHLPVASNLVMQLASTMAALRAFRCDRTRGFNRLGLRHLSDSGAHTRAHLEVLVVGVFRHATFEKQDVACFVARMEALKEFSLLDQERALVRLTGTGSPGDKVLVYSALKRAILDSEQEEAVAGKRRREEVAVVDSEEEVLVVEEEVQVVGGRMGGGGSSSSRGSVGSRKLLGDGGSGGGVEGRRRSGGDEGRKRSGGEESGRGRMVTSLRALAVVDRRLKPHYLLEAAPGLTRLGIDWQVRLDFYNSAYWICLSLQSYLLQEELCHPPFRRYPTSWFPEMLRGSSWAHLARGLTRCQPRLHLIST